MDPKSRLERLPRWAASRIDGLERQLAEARAEIVTLLGAAEDSPVTMGSLPTRPVPDDHYRFKVQPPLVTTTIVDGKRVEEPRTFRLRDSEGWISVHRENGGLRIHGASQIQVDPKSSNVVEVYLTDRS